VVLKEWNELEIKEREITEKFVGAKSKFL